MCRKHPILLSCIALLYAACNPMIKHADVKQWDVLEIVLAGPANGNPYMDVELSAAFARDDTTIIVPGFYDGDGTYRIRFSPGTQGVWTYLTTSNAPALSDKKGTFTCIAPDDDNHGPIQIVNTFYLQYSDGTPFYSVGTTAYQWTSVDQSIQEKTVQTLKNAPFNKIRMCVFPKYYRYGNDTEPWAYPYQHDGDTSDLTRPNYTFFQNFDKRIQQLLDLDIQADVILFHPYDTWGYSKMGDAMNKRYARYMIARVSAYRNVWWSLANEWDVPAIRDSIDWEAIGTLLQQEDPHQRLRGIHNWYNTEDHFYDHSRPWITHVSAQTSSFQQAIEWRTRYRKPLLFDEMRYEGDVPSGWGNLTGEEMACYFWMAGLSGGYPTHGETYENHADDGTEVRWWAKGGTLVGESPERIRFFREIMEQAPVTEMTPSLDDQGAPDKLNNNIYLFSKPGVYYLAYVADSGQTISIDLPGTEQYYLELIDTWNMTSIESLSVDPKMLEYETRQPFVALRVRMEN